MNNGKYLLNVYDKQYTFRYICLVSKHGASNSRSTALEYAYRSGIMSVNSSTRKGAKSEIKALQLIVLSCFYPFQFFISIEYSSQIFDSKGGMGAAKRR